MCASGLPLAIQQFRRVRTQSIREKGGSGVSRQQQFILAARRSRLELSGSLHPVTACGGKSKDIYLYKTDRPRWMDLPGEARNRHNCSFIAKLESSLAT